MFKFRSDEALLKSCIQNEPRAWAELIRRYGNVVFGTIRNTLKQRGRISCRDMVNEIYQEVFVELWSKERFLNLRQGEHLKSFIISLAVFRTLDALRRVRRLHKYEAQSINLDDESKCAASNTTAMDIGFREVLHLAESEMAALPRKDAFILRMSIQENLTHQQIANLARIPIDTVSSIIRRSKLRLRQSLVKKGVLDAK